MFRNESRGTYDEFAVGSRSACRRASQESRGVDRNQQLVALAVAAAHIYREVMGKTIEPMTVAEENAILHDGARAVSRVAAIYGASKSARR